VQPLRFGAAVFLFLSYTTSAVTTDQNQSKQRLYCHNRLFDVTPDRRQYICFCQWLFLLKNKSAICRLEQFDIDELVLGSFYLSTLLITGININTYFLAVGLAYILNHKSHIFAGLNTAITGAVVIKIKVERLEFIITQIRKATLCKDK
jgi:hypothetical protein